MTSQCPKNEPARYPEDWPEAAWKALEAKDEQLRQFRSCLNDAKDLLSDSVLIRNTDRDAVTADYIRSGLRVVRFVSTMNELLGKAW